MTYCTYDTNCQNPIIIEKLVEENEQLKQQNQNLILMLEEERKLRVNDETLQEICRLEQRIEKMKNCINCKNMIKGTRDICNNCFNLRYWELTE